MPTPRRSQRITADSAQRLNLLDLLANDATAQGYPSAAVFSVRLALEEAIANAFRHGQPRPSDSTILVDWQLDPNEIKITVEDHGEGFEPDAVPDPRDEDRLQLPSGRGLLLMRAYMTSVEHNDKGNRVTMRYAKPLTNHAQAAQGR